MSISFPLLKAHMEQLELTEQSTPVPTEDLMWTVQRLMDRQRDSSHMDPLANLLTRVVRQHEEAPAGKFDLTKKDRQLLEDSLPGLTDLWQVETKWTVLAGTRPHALPSKGFIALLLLSGVERQGYELAGLKAHTFPNRDAAELYIQAMQAGCKLRGVDEPERLEL